MEMGAQQIPLPPKFRSSMAAEDVGKLYFMCFLAQEKSFEELLPCTKHCKYTK